MPVTYIYEHYGWASPLQYGGTASTRRRASTWGMYFRQKAHFRFACPEQPPPPSPTLCEQGAMSGPTISGPDAEPASATYTSASLTGRRRLRSAGSGGMQRDKTKHGYTVPLL